MAQNTTISVPADTWTQITDADVTSITFQVLGNEPFYVKGTATASAPTDKTGAVIYHSGRGERNVALADLFPGISAARVYVLSAAPGQVVVSHA